MPGPSSTKIAAKADLPHQTVVSMLQLGDFVHTIRAGLNIRQEELAWRAGVGRQWIGELEQGKPSLESAMVLRTLEALGFELTLTPYDPPPPWLAAARRDRDRRQAEILIHRRHRRATRREAARLQRLAENATGVMAELE